MKSKFTNGLFHFRSTDDTFIFGLDGTKPDANRGKISDKDRRW